MQNNKGGGIEEVQPQWKITALGLRATEQDLILLKGNKR
jgi:hypothetical protein